MVDGGRSHVKIKEAVEKIMVGAVLSKFEGNREKSADYLRMSKSNMIQRVQKFGLSDSDSWKSVDICEMVDGKNAIEEIRDEINRVIIEEALVKCGGNQREAAYYVEWAERKFCGKIKQYRIDWEKYLCESIKRKNLDILTDEEGRPFKILKSKEEKKAIAKRAVNETEGNMIKASKLLGITVNHLRDVLKTY